MTFHTKTLLGDNSNDLFQVLARTITEIAADITSKASFTHECLFFVSLVLGEPILKFLLKQIKQKLISWL